MTLETLYAEREPTHAILIARDLATRPDGKRPQYVIVANEFAVGAELVRILDAAGIRTFMTYSAINATEDRSRVGRPREQYAHWIGSLEAVADDVGYRTAHALIERGRAAGLAAPDGKLHLIALSGDRSTPNSVLRAHGLRAAVAEAPDVVLQQEVFASYNRDRARTVTEVLLRRYPHARLLWSGNDLMAFGAMDALAKRGGMPGKDMLFATFNNSRKALEDLQAGRIAALAGGQFIQAAWAMVLIHDYHRGVDFAKVEGTTSLLAPVFALFTDKDAETFLARYGDDRFDKVDFRRFSRVHNRKLGSYDFRFEQLLR